MPTRHVRPPLNRKRQPPPPGPLRQTWACPTCGHVGPARDKQLLSLRRVHAAAVAELATRVNAGAEPGDWSPIASLVCDVARRLQALEAEGG